ncbi:cupin domain-containing protein [Halomarina ordinaria]|uniref:Cupin domain-containing protein n=1 Tax=Halomarina ordinaria TaxID=3033939 RepID=A0ABD5UBE9_9EURY|nr:cupin domain-containing protein [Halomarina sp. PSRA2]
MTYQTASPEDVESVIDEEYGGMWFLRDALDAEAVGVTVLELEPGAKGKEHDHAGDDHEEVYVVVDGRVDVDCGDDTVTLERNEAIRLSPDQRRQLVNRGDERARLVLAGAP